MLEPIEKATEVKAEEELHQPDAIAVIGMSGHFPGALTLSQFWRNLCDGMESVTQFTDAQLLAAGVDAALLESPRYVKAGILLDGIDLFDAAFFGFAPKEAQVADPQKRIFLECAWEALENAGYDPDRVAGKVGVFAGAGMDCSYRDNLVFESGFL